MRLNQGAGSILAGALRDPLARHRSERIAARSRSAVYDTTNASPRAATPTVLEADSPTSSRVAEDTRPASSTATT